MRIISRKRLVEFWEVHEGAQGPLRKWFKAMSGATFATFADIRRTFARHADPVQHWVVFNVGGAGSRVITTVNYEQEIVYVRHVFTHAEYERWNEKLRDDEANKDRAWMETRTRERKTRATERTRQQGARSAKKGRRRRGG